MGVMISENQFAMKPDWMMTRNTRGFVEIHQTLTGSGLQILYPKSCCPRQLQNLLATPQVLFQPDPSWSDRSDFQEVDPLGPRRVRKIGGRLRPLVVIL